MLVKNIETFLRKGKTNSKNMVANDIKIFLRWKTKAIGQK